MRNLNNFRQVVESPKNTLDGKLGWDTFVQKIHLSKKYISLAKTLYTKDLSNITFNYLCKKFTKLLMSFLKLYVICYDTTPLYFVGLNITYFLQK